MFEKEHVKGIIMRPARQPVRGRYERRAQKVADAFIESGTLVSMVGVGGAQRKDETATKSDHEPKVPVAVLVNSTRRTARRRSWPAHSKTSDRGVVIGEGTFGKGSVCSVLFDIQSPISFDADKSETTTSSGSS